MTGLQLFAFYILPIIVVLIGWIAVVLHERHLDKVSQGRRPGQ